MVLEKNCNHKERRASGEQAEGQCGTTKGTIDILGPLGLQRTGFLRGLGDNFPQLQAPLGYPLGGCDQSTSGNRCKILRDCD